MLMKLKFLIVIGATMIIFAAGSLFGAMLSNFTDDDDSNELTTITFLYNDSFSGIMPINPGYNVIVNLNNNTEVSFEKGNYSVTYLVVSDGFRHHNSSGEC